MSDAARGYTPEQEAEYWAWYATLDPADIAEDPTATTIGAYFEWKLCEADMAERAARHVPAGEAEPPAGDEIPW